MILTTRAERQWFLRNLALGLFEYLGVAAPPVPVEELLKHPPDVLSADFGVVDMYSNLWDATFARLTNQRGSIFVRVDMAPDERRFVLAREMLSALITSAHGRAMGLPEMLMADLRESAEYFARHFLAPERLLAAFRKRGGDAAKLAEAFNLPPGVALRRWQDPPFSVN